MTLLQKTSIFEGVDLGNTLKKASQAMGETVSGLTTQLINPFKSVTESVRGGIATISEAQSVLSSNLNAYKSAAIEGIDVGLKNITGGLFNIGDIGSVLTYQDGFKVNTDELLRIGSKGLGFNVYSMQNLKDQIANGFLDELANMSGGLSTGLFYMDGTKLRISDDWKFQMGTSIIDFIAKDNEGFGSIVNVAGMNSILNTMLNETVRYGILDGYNTFGDQYIFQSDYHDALISAVSIAVSNGDAESVKKILEIIQTEGANKVNAKYPDLIEQLLGNFRLQDTEDTSDYPRIRSSILEVCTKLKGVDWYKSYTQLGMCINMGLVNSISDDAKNVLMEETSLVPLLAGAGVFSDLNAIDVFQQNFPKAVRFEN